MIPLTLAIFVIYCLLILWLIKGLHEERPTSFGGHPTLPISVIVPFRNEADNLSSFLESISRQSLSKEHYEVILVDDHSEDEGSDIAAAYIQKLKLNQVRIVWLEKNQGKKAAIQLGIKESVYDLIVQTDMDCAFGPDWLLNLHKYQGDNNDDLTILPVNLKAQQMTLQEILQEIEFNTLQAVTFGMAKNHFPILCSAANMMYKKSTYTEANDLDNTAQISSGDDVFLLHSANKRNLIIGQYLDPSILITTFATSSWKQLFEQKSRWVGKSKAVKSWPLTLTIFLTGITNLLFLALLPFHFKFFLFLLIMKIVLERYFLRQYLHLINLHISDFKILVGGTAYPFYTVFLLLYSLINTPTWKGRKVKV